MVQNHKTIEHNLLIQPLLWLELQEFQSLAQLQASALTIISQS